MSGETTAASRACSVKTGPAARALEKACWVVGLLLLALYCSARTYGELERREAVSAFADLSTGADTLVTRDSAVRSLPENRTPDQTQWSASRIRAFAASPRAPAESASLPAALLRISRVGLEVPVYADMTERNLTSRRRIDREDRSARQRRKHRDRSTSRWILSGARERRSRRRRRARNSGAAATVSGHGACNRLAHRHLAATRDWWAGRYSCDVLSVLFCRQCAAAVHRAGGRDRVK